jgi:hypothetical protein
MRECVLHHLIFNFIQIIKYSYSALLVMIAFRDPMFEFWQQKLEIVILSRIQHNSASYATMDVLAEVIAIIIEQ